MRIAMAGVKRKHNASGSAAAFNTEAQNAPNSSLDDTSNTRVTRSTRSTRGNTNNRGGRSLIVKLSLANARSNDRVKAEAQAQVEAQATSTRVGRETRTTRGRAATAASQPESSASFQVPETPRAKRVKRNPPVEATPVEATPRATRQSARQTARQSARLKINGPASPKDASVDPESKPVEASPSKAAPGVRTRTAANVDESSNAPDNGSVVSETVENLSTAEVAQGVTAESNADELSKKRSPENHDNADSVAASQNEPSSNAANTPSEEPKKRKSSDATETADSPSKKPKLEDEQVEYDLERQLQNGTDGKPEAATPAEANGESRTEESRQITEETQEGTEATPDNFETVSNVSNGKGRGGGRGGRGGRGRGRGGRSGRGGGASKAKTNAVVQKAPAARGRGATRAPRSKPSERRFSDDEYARSPSPVPAAQKLRERQRELDKIFKRVSASQRFALTTLAQMNENKLLRSRNAHKRVPEYGEVSEDLKAALAEKHRLLTLEYDLKVAQENRLFEAEKARIETKYRESARNIQEEHLQAALGDYMAFVEGRRAAEDDEHTETDGSDTENDTGLLIPKPAKLEVRGYYSSQVRDPAGAAAFERADSGWEDFVQRAKLGGEVSPQMRQMSPPSRFAGMPATEAIDMLLTAVGVIENQRANDPRSVPPTFSETLTTALSTLADVATSDVGRGPSRTSPETTRALPPVRQAPTTHRTLLPQFSAPGRPTDVRSLMLPPPTPQRQQRQLLPAGPEPLGLPNPFAARGGGPRQLPPPPGSNLQPPPVPGYMPGLYLPPPPAHGQSPHGHPQPGSRPPY